MQILNPPCKDFLDFLEEQEERNLKKIKNSTAKFSYYFFFDEIKMRRKNYEEHKSHCCFSYSFS